MHFNNNDMEFVFPFEQLYQWSKTSRARSRTLAILSFLALMMDPTQATFRFKGNNSNKKLLKNYTTTEQPVPILLPLLLFSLISLFE